ncbi:MAG: kynureninase [Gemmatimonadetes bacterium]|nr:MAG: kynureninase [Gemmatimonadota bacterium]
MNPEELAKHYTRFRVTERILLTGHSHQAWPDVAFEAQQQAWLDAAEHVDDVWDLAFAKADEVRRGFARLMDDTPERIALAQNTHELVVRFLSALPLRKRPQLVTTDAEFHTIRRQLDRLAEEGIEVIKVPAMPAATLAERLAISVDDRTAAVLVSAVLYTNAHIVPNLRVVQEACERVGAELLVDAYHALNVVPFSLIAEGLQRAYVVGGGYKYCQLGPGNAFLRFPQDSDLRPVVTGWFSEFTDLSRSPASGRVAYGPGPARFAGATYDFTSHYRAAAVFKFFEDQKLTAPKLRELNQHQIEILSGVSRNDAIGGFLAIPAPRAGKIQKALRKKNIWTDYRGEMLRLGPAPYVTDAQISEAAEALGVLLQKKL